MKRVLYQHYWQEKDSDGSVWFVNEKIECLGNPAIERKQRLANRVLIVIAIVTVLYCALRIWG